jgi:hypothetical protein
MPLELTVQDGGITVAKEGSGFKVIVPLNNLNEEAAKEVAEKMALAK